MVSLALADDVLALVTKGKVTSDSAGVTKLSLDDKMQVKGGAFQSVYSCFTGTDSCLALAVSQTITGIHYRDFKTVITDEEPYNTNKHIGFLAQNHWTVSKLGRPYNYFTYSAVVFDRATGKIYKETSQVLNYNGIVRELSYRYKNQFDRNFGGLRIY